MENMDGMNDITKFASDSGRVNMDQGPNDNDGDGDGEWGGDRVDDVGDIDGNMELEARASTRRCIDCDCRRLPEPYVGMQFRCMELLYEYYKGYAKGKGFGIIRKHSIKDESSECVVLVLACCRQGKYVRKATIKEGTTHKRSGCNARVRGRKRGSDGVVVLTVVENTHNHSFSPSQARHCNSHKVLDMSTKRKLELNDMAGIRPCKSFQACVVEVGGHENLTFGEKECRNYIARTRRWKIREGDG